jgi:hypothetical protein
MKELTANGFKYFRRYLLSLGYPPTLYKFLLLMYKSVFLVEIND